MMVWVTRTHCFHSHIYSRTINVSDMQFHCILYVSYKQLDNSLELLFFALWLLSLRCFIWRSRNANKEECKLFAAMQHSQPNMTLYQEVILLTWGGNMFLKDVSLIIILPYLYLAYLSHPYSIRLTMLLCRSLTDTCNKKIGTNCGIVWPSMVILRQSLDIGGWKIEGNKE